MGWGFDDRSSPKSQSSRDRPPAETGASAFPRQRTGHALTVWSVDDVESKQGGSRETGAGRGRIHTYEYGFGMTTYGRIWGWTASATDSWDQLGRVSGGSRPWDHGRAYQLGRALEGRREEKQAHGLAAFAGVAVSYNLTTYALF